MNQGTVLNGTANGKGISSQASGDGICSKLGSRGNRDKVVLGGADEVKGKSVASSLGQGCGSSSCYKGLEA